ncbi:hypothetical protein [Salinactinospora qingdaonensis]|uniref:Uncharacterized protein n=1 Tax=Salinactinospora qingdaonensis TaxID=702744 RepID=A0ABP7GJV9_9ACTN
MIPATDVLVALTNHSVLDYFRVKEGEGYLVRTANNYEVVLRSNEVPALLLGVCCAELLQHGEGLSGLQMQLVEVAQTAWGGARQGSSDTARALDILSRLNEHAVLTFDGTGPNGGYEVQTMAGYGLILSDHDIAPLLLGVCAGDRVDSDHGLYQRGVDDLKAILDGLVPQTWDDPAARAEAPSVSGIAEPTPFWHVSPIHLLPHAADRPTSPIRDPEGSRALVRISDILLNLAGEGVIERHSTSDDRLHSITTSDGYEYALADDQLVAFLAGVCAGHHADRHEYRQVLSEVLDAFLAEHPHWSAHE